MAAGANYAWANRQMITYWVRQAVNQVMKKEAELNIVYDIAHNIAKLEEYEGKKYIVHRKGATRCFGPNRKELPDKYQSTGQPVIIPGSMGTSSYVLVGTDDAMKNTFGSTCHGAGRLMSRSQAIRTIDLSKLKKDLAGKGIVTRTGSAKGMLEEAPQAYKDVDEVVEVVHQANIARKVARLKPLAVIKG